MRCSDHAFSSPRDVILQNDLARATYEDVNAEQQGSHSLYLRARGEWSRLTSHTYGDYTYFVSTIVKPAVSVELTALGPNLSEARFRYEHDVKNNGGAEYHVTIWKTIAVSRCAPGMFVHFASDPRNPDGERELGTGMALPIGFSRSVVALHPEARQHTNLEMGGSLPPYWAASLWLFDQPAPLMGVLVLGHPMPTYTYQFDPRQGGYLTINVVDEQDVVPERYQVFLGGSVYDGSLARVELEDHVGPEPIATPYLDASGGLVVPLAADGQLSFPFVVPLDGSYSLALRYAADEDVEVQLTVDGAAQAVVLPATAALENAIALRNVPLRAGKHLVEVNVAAPMILDAAVVLPFDGNPGFPESIARSVDSILHGKRQTRLTPALGR